MQEAKYFTINNISNRPILFFEDEKLRDSAYEKMNPVYKKRFGKGVISFKIEKQ